MKKTQPILIAVSATEQAGSLEVSSQAAIATDNLASGNVVADNSRERGTNARRNKGTNSKQIAGGTVVKFPRCDAAVRNREGGEWALADAVVAECSEPGMDGVKNESYAKMEAMREEIAKNHGVDLSFERIRKLRKVASAFPPGRRRPAVSLEAHLEAGTPDALDALIKSAPKGIALTRDSIRRLKHPDEKVEQDQQKAERRHQVEDQRKALQNLCRQLEQENEQLRLRNTDLCRTNGKEPEPFPPPLARRRTAHRLPFDDIVDMQRQESFQCNLSGTRSRLAACSFRLDTEHSWSVGLSSLEGIEFQRVSLRPRARPIAASTAVGVGSGISPGGVRKTRTRYPRHLLRRFLSL
jgi:hypothetical protein